MKLLRFGKLYHEKPAVIDSDNIIRDLSSVIDDINPLNINDDIVGKIKSVNLRDFPKVSTNERIGSCVCNPEKFIGIGLNYTDHAKETGAKTPSEPIVFLKANSCISGPNDNVVIPKNSKKTDWEIELGIVIGKQAKYISKDEAQNFILGYCLVNDVSEREFQIERSSGQWDKGKGCDTFGPIGPYIVTKDEIDDVKNLNLELKVNGITMQKGNTKNMIFDVNHIVYYLSNFMTLNPGDIICTGTPPGVGMGKKPPIFLKRGDTIMLHIDKLGTQKQKVV
jgi:2-keto-4-pentenoate hydratase/2-oxohepta-3-ene-1,7-dioic acid hydratase in catechol pathway